MPLEKYKTEKIQGRDVDFFIVDKIKKDVKTYGKSGSHVTVPFKYKDCQVEVKIIAPRPFICGSCLDKVSAEKNFSPDPELCNVCFEANQRFEEWKKKPVKEKICRYCKKQLSNEEFKGNWDTDQHFECVAKEDAENFRVKFEDKIKEKEKM